MKIDFKKMKSTEQVIIDFFENSALYYVKTDLEGKYTYVNSRFQEKFGFIAKNFLGLPFAITIHEGDVEKCNHAAYACMVEPTKQVMLDVRKPNQLGGFFWTTWEFSALTNDKGEAVEIQCVGYDTTETMIQKEKLRYSQEIFRAIFDGSSNMMMFVLPSYEIVLANTKARNFAKQVKEIDKINGQYLDKLLKSIFDTQKNNFTSILEVDFNRALKGETLFNDYYLTYRDGEAMWLHLDYYPVMMEEELLGVAIVGTDITDNKETEMLVSTKNSTLQEIGEMVSHELRAPISSILGLIIVMDKHDLSEDNQMLMELLEKTAQELDKITKLIVNKTYIAEMIEKKINR